MAEQIRQILLQEHDHKMDPATALWEEVPDLRRRALGRAFGQATLATAGWCNKLANTTSGTTVIGLAEKMFYLRTLRLKIDPVHRCFIARRLGEADGPRTDPHGSRPGSL